MTKAKTHKGASKRFKVTKNGKVLRRDQSISKLLTKKSKSRRRKKANLHHVSKSDVKRIKKLLPNG